MPFSNVTPDAVKTSTCGACGAQGQLRKYVEYKSLDRLCAPLFICTDCTVIYNASGEFDEQDVRTTQSKWGDNPDWYKVPTGEAFAQKVTDCDTSFRFLEEHLGVRFGGTYLDIGAGDGVRGASALNFFERAYVFDHVEDRLRTTARVVNSDRYFVLGVEDLENIEADTVLIWHAMEHLLSPGGVFHLCTRILKPGGNLLVQVPVLSAEHVYPGHYYFYNEVAFERMAERAGLHVMRFMYDYAMNAITATFRKPAELNSAA
jgi:SAM-dependent methyltransferase